MENLTVGYIEDKLRKFNKETIVRVGCNCCNRGSVGTENTIKIIDNTNQTYGYAEIVLNSSIEPNLELSPNKEKYYENVINNQKEEITELKQKVKIYLDYIERIKNSTELAIFLGGK